MTVEEAIAECRKRLAQYHGTTVRKTDVEEWLDVIARAAEPGGRYGVDYGAWGT